ncbi:hypothetical protein P2L35_13395 [Enterococcus faecium]|nr:MULTISPECIES: hypothetical protein [Bacilli]MCM3187093.1 hypothetical protein [Priestia megaterium]MDN3040689.1 hypothetical protein [Enterococcus faecium]
MPSGGQQMPEPSYSTRRSRPRPWPEAIVRGLPSEAYPSAWRGTGIRIDQ